MINSIIYQSIEQGEKHACGMMRGEDAVVVYIPTSTPLCLGCKIENDAALEKGRKSQ